MIQFMIIWLLYCFSFARSIRSSSIVKADNLKNLQITLCAKSFFSQNNVTIVEIHILILDVCGLCVAADENFLCTK